jgi:hypothetical protein
MGEIFMSSGSNHEIFSRRFLFKFGKQEAVDLLLKALHVEMTADLEFRCA